MLLRSSVHARQRLALHAARSHGQQRLPLARSRALWYKSAQTDWKRRGAQRIDWENPGERLKFVPEDMLYAMPPPPPTSAYSMSQFHLRLLRSRIPVVIVFLFATGHWAVSSIAESRTLACDVQRRAPWLAEVLAQLGFISQLKHTQPVDRAFTAERIFTKYSSATRLIHGASAEPGIPLREAVGLAELLLSAGRSAPAARHKALLGDDDADFLAEARGIVGDVVARRVASGLNPAMARAHPLRREEALSALGRASSGLSDELLCRVSNQFLGVQPIQRETAARLSELFDFVAAESAAVGSGGGSENRQEAQSTAADSSKAGGWTSSGFWGAPVTAASETVVTVSQGGVTVVEGRDRECTFTVPLLAALCEELGLGFLEAEARDALTESAAVRTGAVRLTPSDWLVVEPASEATKFRKRHGEQTQEELERIAEEVARAGLGATGVELTPGTDWSAVKSRADELAQDSAKEGGSVPAFREVVQGEMLEEESVRNLRERSRLVVRSHVRVPLRRSEFVDFIAKMGASCSIEEAELVKYVEVFQFMAGLRDASEIGSS
jgi:hypothetical protein